jgi:hypothetical protein
MKRLTLVLVAVVALAAPASALAGNVVLKVERASHLAAVVHAKHVMLVHTAATSKLRVGQSISMHSRRLANGMFSATQVRVLGRARHVAFNGFVLSSSKSAGRVTLSAGGAAVTVKSNDQPKPGSEVDVNATVSNTGDLEDDNIDVVTPTAPGGSIEGHVFALGGGTITVQSDEQMLVLKVPSGFNLGTLAVGDEVLAQFTQASDGSLTLTSLTADESAAAANDDNQGDENGSQSTGSGDDNNDNGDTGSTSSSSSSSSGSGGDQGQDG